MTPEIKKFFTGLIQVLITLIVRAHFKSMGSWIDIAIKGDGLGHFLWRGSCVTQTTTDHPWIFLAILFLSTWLIAIRWREIFNGGSDSMTALIALALTIAQACNSHTTMVKACFAYIAVQVLASYFIAGLSKVKNKKWRDGLALAEFSKTPRYDSPSPRIPKLVENKATAQKISLALIAFELSFPLALACPQICTAYIVLGLISHLINFYVFGLNRFFFAWAAGYPALYFSSARG